MTDTPHIPGAEIADARLSEIAGWAETLSTFPKAEGHPPPQDYADIASACRELLAAREALAARIVPPPNTDLIKRLRTVSNMINMGEKIAWGSETMLMDEAADALAAPAANVPPQVNEAVAVAWFHIPTGGVVDPLAKDLLCARFTKELGRDVSSEFEPLCRPETKSS